MARNASRWYSVGSLRVYLLLCLLDWSLFVLGYLMPSIEKALTGPAAPYGITGIWHCAFAAPVGLAFRLGWDLDPWWAVNPFLTGFVWWLAWRMWVLMRRRRPE